MCFPQKNQRRACLEFVIVCFVSGNFELGVFFPSFLWCLRECRACVDDDDGVRDTCRVDYVNSENGKLEEKEPLRRSGMLNPRAR